MSTDTPAQESDSPSTPLAGTIAGVLAFITAVGISFVAVLIGKGAVQGQIANPLITGSFWFVTAALALGAVVVSGFLVLFLSLELINVIGKPEIQDRTEYTIIGMEGFAGGETHRHPIEGREKTEKAVY